ncbi:MAG: cytidylate kinase family protein [Nanoarchaeota archaeon]|nr:cytidylate kinase family protein [Nanoarchaeota archaeon]
MKITVSGIVGSGKSTIAKMLAEKLGIEYFSVGKIMRDMAVERGLTMQEFTEVAKGDKEIDFELDNRQKALNSSGGNFVMDSRLGFHFISDSFKVFLKVDLSEAAKRIHGSAREGEKYFGVEEALEYLEKRILAEKIRYKQCYDIDFPCEEKFDLVIDTTKKNPEEIVKEILSSVPDESC